MLIGINGNMNNPLLGSMPVALQLAIGLGVASVLTELKQVESNKSSNKQYCWAEHYGYVWTITAK